MRLAGHTLGTPGLTIPQAIALFREAGLDAAELIYQDDYSAGLPVGDLAAARSAKSAADGEGIDVVGITPYTTSINSLADAEWTQGIDHFRGAIDVAHELGATRIRVYAGSWHPGYPDERASWERLAEALTVLAPVAHSAGAVLCVENHFGTMTQTAADTARLVREVGHPGVRVLYDQANLTFTHDEEWRAALAAQGDLIGHVHVKDLVFKAPDKAFTATETARVKAEERNVRSRIVGDGVVPWVEILPALIERGYDDVLSIEYEYRWHPQDLPEPLEGFRRSATALRAILDDVSEGAP